jgi:hypothetical protein
VLRKDGEDKLDRSYEKGRGTTGSHRAERNILQTIKRGKANEIGRNCLLKDVIEEEIEGRMVVNEIRGRRCKQLLESLKEKTGFLKLEGEALVRTRLGRGYGPDVTHTVE